MITTTVVTLFSPFWAQTRPVWPDLVDRTAIMLFILWVVVLPALGYWCLVADIRAYLRALRGALIKVTNHFPSIPAWARFETPHCLKALGLRLPCSEADVKRAYRRKAELMHPDRGGDKAKFMILQRQFEQAIEFLREHHSELAIAPTQGATLSANACSSQQTGGVEL